MTLVRYYLGQSHPTFAQPTTNDGRTWSSGVKKGASCYGLNPTAGPRVGDHRG